LLAAQGALFGSAKWLGKGWQQALAACWLVTELVGLAYKLRESRSELLQTKTEKTTLLQLIWSWGLLTQVEIYLYYRNKIYENKNHLYSSCRRIGRWFPNNKGLR